MSKAKFTYKFSLILALLVVWEIVFWGLYYLIVGEIGNFNQSSDHVMYKDLMHSICISFSSSLQRLIFLKRGITIKKSKKSMPEYLIHTFDQFQVRVAFYVTSFFEMQLFFSLSP